MKKNFFLLLAGPALFFALPLKAQSDINSDSLIIQDRGWPRTVNTDKATLTFHQPQIYRWDEFREIGAWVALEIAPKNQGESFVGAVKIKAKTETDLESRSVLIYEREVEDVKFDGVNPDLEQKIEDRLKAFQSSPEVISLDRMIAMVDEEIFDLQGTATNTEPPAIYYSDNPHAVLVITDGKPIWVETEVKNLKFAVNTNWQAFKHEKEGSIYLLNDSMWLKAETLSAPFKKTTELPKEFNKLASKEGWEDLKNVVPAKTVDAPSPRVFVSTEPAELLLLDGPPKFKAIEGATGVKAVLNTEADLFYYAENDQYYFLVSGRWFRAGSMQGPWEFATNDMPGSFADIPEESEWGHVLSSIPGTIQAKEAAIQAMIPQTAQLSRDAQPPEVKYDGEPKFKQIDDSKVSYASNSQYDVIHYDDKYYLCYQGAWFISSYPTYGWATCTYIPPPIYAIPPTCPVYHVSYVHSYGYTSSYVTFGYTSGYMGIHISFGVPFYGTGYYYPPYYYYPGYGYPRYYGYPYSYGFRATYNPYTGAYGRQARVYGPYGGAGRGAAYNPRTGTYARGRSAWGPYGGVGEAAAYNPRTGTRAYAQTAQGYGEGATRAGAYNSRTGTYGATRQGHDPYGQWGQSVVGKGDDWARTGHYTDENGTRYGFETSEGARGAGFRSEDGQAFAGKNKAGDLYVGKDGNVFKKEGDNWYQRGDGDWNPVSQDNLSQEQRDNIQNRTDNISQEQRDQLQERAGNIDADRRANVQDRAGNLTPEQRANAQERADNRTPEQRARAQERAGNLSPEQRNNARNRANEATGNRSQGAAGNRNLGPQRSKVPQNNRYQPRGTQPGSGNTRDYSRTPNRSSNRSAAPTRDYRARERGNYRSGNYNNYQRQQQSGTRPARGSFRGRRN
ncbi:MAG: hypothetical protein OER04_13850 [Cyclobacteriaceae bacterium]|nr:hypothetical protein [Cyclobacteriaceae bacterium]